MQRVRESAGSLAAAGIAEGEFVGLTIADEIEHLVATLALLHLGSWQICLATHDPVATHAELSERTGLRRIVSDRDPLIAVESVVRWPVPASGKGIGLSQGGGIALRTSGTTGRSNLVPLSSGQLARQAMRHGEYSAVRYLRPASIEHNNGRRHRLYCAYQGGTNVFRPNDAYDLADVCRVHGVTRLDLSTMHAAGLASADRGDAFRQIGVCIAGSPTPISLRQAIQAHVTPLFYSRYGTTECGTISVAGPGEHDAEEPVGRPVAEIELQIADASGAALPIGVPGHIRLRADGMADGYLDSPQQTAERFRDGWFWPGDYGYLRADGRLVISGRVDEMIILNSINIFPSEIERILELHPAVATAAATGLASGAHGQIPVAAVELHSGSNTDERTLLGFARERLGLRAPRKIKIVQALPRSPQGKLLRRALPPLFAASGNIEGSKV